jgi:hypothetical protein
MPASARDELLGRLLSVPLDRFVEQRNLLVRELREGGDRETAAWLAGLRRPAPGVWALDQLARGDRRRMAALLELGAELRGVQAGAMRGDREAVRRLRDVGAQVQRAVDDMVRRAADVLRDAGHGASTDTQLGMAATLRAAIAGDDEARAGLAAGLLLAPVTDVDGFGFGGGSATLAEGEAATAAPQPAAQRRSDAQAETERKRHRQAAEAAARAAAAADAELAQRRADADRAGASVDQLRDRLRALQEELSEAEAEARAATLAVDEAVRRAREAHRDADRLQAQLPPHR